MRCYLFDTLAAERLIASQAVNENREIHSLKRKRHRRVERPLRDGCPGVPREAGHEFREEDALQLRTLRTST